MTWLTFRQHRLELAALFVMTIGLAALLLTLVHVVESLRFTLGVDQCEAALFLDPVCVEKLNEYRSQLHLFRAIPLSLYVFPALVAAFLGGPFFAREFERGTHRLAWTQGITRVRWAATKLGSVLLAVLACGLILAAVDGQSRILTIPAVIPSFFAFDFEGPAIVAYLIFAFALGAASGMLIRRTVPAMFVALLTFVGVRVLVEVLVRPKFMAPLVASDFAPLPAGAWSLGVHYLSAAGQEVADGQVNDLMGHFTGQGDFAAYLNANGVFVQQLYQPADRYWLFQSIEAVIFIALSAALIALTVWLVRRRPA